MKTDYVKKIAVTATGDENTEVLQIHNTNRYTMFYKPFTYPIPHYIDVVLSQDNKETTHQIWVSLPGRRTQCPECGADSHWWSQCPQRRNKQNKTPEEPQNTTEQPKQPENHAEQLAASQETTFIHTRPLRQDNTHTLTKDQERPPRIEEAQQEQPADLPETTLEITTPLKDNTPRATPKGPIKNKNTKQIPLKHRQKQNKAQLGREPALTRDQLHLNQPQQHWRHRKNIQKRKKTHYRQRKNFQTNQPCT
jgi:hypothetical protein